MLYTVQYINSKFLVDNQNTKQHIFALRVNRFEEKTYV